MLIINENSKSPLYIQIYQQLKSDILSGAAKPGSKLKSSRALSAEHKVSRNTVELAYGQLFAEGLIRSKPRVGYLVEDAEHFDLAHCAAADCDGCAAQETCVQKAEQARVLYDFRPEKLVLDELPCNQFHGLTNRVFTQNMEELATHKDVFGEQSLREEIRDYLRQYRGVVCDASQIIVTPGTQFCLDLICRFLQFLRDAGVCVAMENPGNAQSRRTFLNNGLQVLPVEVDEHGISAKALAGTQAQAVYVTPSSQFPTGVVMAENRRQALAQWAAKNRAFVIEDDRGCHYQYGSRPIPAVHALLPEHTFYLGGFSDTLFPCLNVSFMVVPPQVRKTLRLWYEGFAPFVSYVSQKTMELFITDGHLERHLRKHKKCQREKRDALMQHLAQTFGETVHVSATASGMHLVVEALWNTTESALIAKAQEAGVAVYPMSEYEMSTERRSRVLLSYSGIVAEDIPPAVARLYEAWHN